MVLKVEQDPKGPAEFGICPGNKIAGAEKMRAVAGGPEQGCGEGSRVHGSVLAGASPRGHSFWVPGFKIGTWF